MLSPPPSPGVTSQLCHSNSRLGRGGIRKPVSRAVALANQRLRPLSHRGSCGYRLMKQPQLRTCEASISQTGDFIVFVLLLSCALGPPSSLSILVRACLCCSLKGAVHTVIGNLQFLGNFSHGIEQE